VQLGHHTHLGSLCRILLCGVAGPLGVHLLLCPQVVSMRCCGVLYVLYPVLGAVLICKIIVFCLPGHFPPLVYFVFRQSAGILVSR
jgi:hypothetical protein